MPAPAIGITLPTLGSHGPFEVPDIAAAARHCEALHFESVWVPDLIVGDGTPAVEATVAAATAAAVTNSVLVGFGVLSLPLRPAPWLAAQIASLQHLSRSRMVVGVGSGGFPESPFWRALDIPAAERGRRTDAALRILGELVAGRPTAVTAGEPASVVTLAPGAEVPPILIGGSSDVAIRRASEFGDGWMPSLLSPDALAEGAARLEQVAADRGRARPGITVGTHGVVGDDAVARAARDALVRSLVDDHGLAPEVAASVPLVGRNPVEFAERVEALRSAGAERIVISPDGGDWFEQCERIADARTQL